MSRKKVVVIGSGFAGLSAASCLAKAGHDVTLLEKNDQAGGRARTWEKDGFTFDMGPSWYWMPEIFEEFFALFGHQVSDFYELKRLDPAYRIYFKGDDTVDIPASLDLLAAEFERREAGSGDKLRAFLKDAEYKYNTAMSDHVRRLSDSFTEFMEPSLILKSIQLEMFSSLRTSVRKKFSNPELQSLLEFPVLFLGATPGNIPAMYSLMNYADLVKGTWFPMGGMGEMCKAFISIAQEQGVHILCNKEVDRILAKDGMVNGVTCNDGTTYEADILVAGSDYHHTEQTLLPKEHRVYSSNYWKKRTMSPSSLLFYIGIDRKIDNILHHNLFFDEDFEQHAHELYDQPQWPSKPLFYLCASSRTDASCAPEGCENLFFLIPLAPGLHDNETLREQYFQLLADRLQKKCGVDIRQHLLVKRSYAMNDFEHDYHAFKGNAYGLANTLRQTAFLKPKIKSSKVRNLFYTGQLTVPGPGVPPAIISGQIAAAEILKQINLQKL
jgi:phytoene desaturase